MVDDTKSMPWGTGLLVLAVTLGTVVAGDLVSRPLLADLITRPETSHALWGLTFILLGTGGLMVVYEAGSFTASLSPLGLYFTLLASAAAWNLAQFGFDEPAIALGILVAAWLLNVALIQEYVRFSRLAAWLQLPPLVWISFLIATHILFWRVSLP